MPASGINIQAWDEEKCRLPRWLFAIRGKTDAHSPSACDLSLQWSTRDDGKWGSRSAFRKSVSISLSTEEIEMIIHGAEELMTFYPGKCLNHDQVHTHGGYSPTRDNNDSVVCYSLCLFDHGTCLPVMYLKKNSEIWTASPWGQKITDLIQPHIIPAYWRKKPPQSRFLP